VVSLLDILVTNIIYCGFMYLYVHSAWSN